MRPTNKGWRNRLSAFFRKRRHEIKRKRNEKYLYKRCVEKKVNIDDIEE